jgi:hypothetical protein
MKKNKAKDHEEKRKSRRLSLNRETIKALDEPSLLELARGGNGDSGGPGCTTNSLVSGG